MSGKCRRKVAFARPRSTIHTLAPESSSSQAAGLKSTSSTSSRWATRGKGAQQLSDDEREQLANDPLNLAAVDHKQNRKHSDGAAATWLPPNRAFRCAYVARQVAVKAKYGLWVTAAERDAIARVLNSCPGEPLLA
jgi:hypothetical protein